MTDPPLVSCIMPTRGRRAFVSRAIDYFAAEDYANRELIVVDDGADPVEDLVPADPRFRYIRLTDVHTVGSKRNVACDVAGGSVIAHWDDDDWYAPNRLRYQVEALLEADADVCGLSSFVLYDPARAKAWQYTYPGPERPWVHGGTLCYRRSYWDQHRFADVSGGEDALFVWSSPAIRVLALPNRSIYVATIHPDNTSPKATDGPFWQPLPLADVRSIVADPSFFEGDGARGPGPPLERAPVITHPDEGTSTSTRPVRNVYACLAHEAPECVIDLVRNLRHFDPESPILLYNGGADPSLFDDFPFDEYGAALVPSPRQMAWGRLHDFSLDSMRFALASLDFDTLTIVDSDQLAAGRGYPTFIAPAIDGRSDIGLLANATETQVPGSAAPPAMAALEEVELWRPFVRRFPGGEAVFPRWCFWPSTVFARDATRELTRLFETDAQLQQIMEQTQIWATEEVILPTLVALLGFEAARSPCSFDYVKYQEPYTVDQVDQALARPDVFWVHPVPRRYDDPLRTHMRRHFDGYERVFAPDTETGDHREPPDGPGLLQTLPLLKQMRATEGWLDDEEADLLAGAAIRALTGGRRGAIAEIGSHSGRATIVLAGVVKALAPDARVRAIDTYDGTVGALDQGLVHGPATLEQLRSNLARAGVADVVEVIVGTPRTVAWNEPLSLLVVDGLHDYPSVSRDLYHFEPSLRPGSLVAFHDYADYFPGVVTFANECVRSGRYRSVARAGSMLVVERTSVA